MQFLCTLRFRIKQNNTNTIYFMTKDPNSNHLGVINDYSRWGSQTDRQIHKRRLLDGIGLGADSVKMLLMGNPEPLIVCGY